MQHFCFIRASYWRSLANPRKTYLVGGVMITSMLLDWSELKETNIKATALFGRKQMNIKWRMRVAGFNLNSETQDCKENPVDLYLSMERFNNKAFSILFICYVQLLWTLFLVLFWKKHERSRSKMQMDGDWSWFSRREDGWRYWGESEGERHRMIEAQKKDELRQEWSV